MRKPLAGLVFVVGLIAGAGGGGASAHELDHPAEGFVHQGPISTSFNAGGEGAEWRLHTTIVTGNPHTDIDFFRHAGEVYLSAGTLAVGPNAGGQTIVRLTKDGEVDPEFVAGHPSAACVSNPSAALGLQHDVEATPKGDVRFNSVWGRSAPGADVQLLLDATDAGGRCHDQAPLGLTGNPRGGLELVDVTDPTAPVEIGLTSHIGEAHTVNVDPARPHIAYVSGSDRVSIDAAGARSNEANTGQPFNLDGFEVVDLSSCMDLPAGTTVEAKRDACRPEVYRFRFELGWTRGTFASGNQAACHEIEIHPGDRLTCAGVDGTLVLDMSGAFDEAGTPRGTPLPCAARASTSSGSTATGATVTDCVVGAGGKDLRVPAWLEMGAPSLEGVKLVGFVNHGGREVSNNAVSHTPDEDIAVSHEAELTPSGRFLIVSDERGGGVIPPDSSCPSPQAQPPLGNGGLHVYDMSKLFTAYPAVLAEDGTIDRAATAEKAREAYARTPEGDAAIARATPIVPGEIECTAHVFQQIPGQHRLFMGWYGQGTRVFDWVEHADGTFEWIERAYFIPEGANTWVSHVFQVDDNGDDTFTYWGASGDFNTGTRGRSSIDVYRVTLPAPAQFVSDLLPECARDRPGAKPAHCDGGARPGNGTAAPAGRSGKGSAASATAGEAPPTKVIDLRDPSLVHDHSAHEHGLSPAATATLAGLTALMAGVLARQYLALPAVRRRRRREAVTGG